MIDDGISHKNQWCQGEWNGYVESGKDLMERRARLAEVPEEWRDSVRAHVATVFAMKEAARLRGTKNTKTPTPGFARSGR